MLPLEHHASHDVCTTLFFRLARKGLEPFAIHRLVKDVYLLVRDGGAFTIFSINRHLETLGWGADVLDSFCFELILSILESELDYTVQTHTLH